MGYYLESYKTEDGFDILRLLEDDFLNSVRLLWNERQYTSAIKLLLSSIDTVSFLAYGDEPNAFCKWVDAYVDLDELKVNSTELWELRNGLLHMTHNESRKVSQGRTKRVIYYMGSKQDFGDDSEVVYLHSNQFLASILNAISKYTKEIAASKESMDLFISKYNLIFSDSRYIKVQSTKLNKS